MGDHLLCTALFKELALRNQNNTWMLSNYPDLFLNNPDINRVVEDSWKTVKYLEKFNKKPKLLYYGKWIGDIDRIEPPKSHIINEIVVKSGIVGEISLRPYWYNRSKKDFLKNKSSYICVQSTKTFSSTPMLNKQWSEQKLQNVVDKLSKRYNVIQLGSKNEPKINNVIDLRGCTINETAKYLTYADFFIGQVGFLMHLARAVDTRSVIIYGGREKAWQSGYPCNQNLESDIECSPCWQNNKCDLQKKCLSNISSEMVLEAVDKLISKLGEELELDKITLY